MRQVSKIGFVSGRRTLSVIASEGPRITIAKNVLKLGQISIAHTEKDIETALAASPKIDVDNLPAELAVMKRYLASPAAVGGKFIPDPNAWQNMSLISFVQTEGSRHMAWPFFAGAG